MAGMLRALILGIHLQSRHDKPIAQRNNIHVCLSPPKLLVDVRRSIALSNRYLISLEKKLTPGNELVFHG